ncbi:MAG: phage tail tape measure protein [Bacteroidaceae bacterium]|nr:phage tail tape measure protein [Bacteroidaceae bacterium]
MGVSTSDFRIALRIDNADAARKLQETKNEIAKLKEEMSRMKKEGKDGTDEYKQMNATLDELNKKARVLRQEAGKTGYTYNELRQNAAKLRRELNNTVPGSEKWKQLQADLKIADARLKEVRASAQGTGISLGKLADGFNRYAAIGASAVATLTGMALTVRGCVNEFAEMEEAESQVTKYTGMAKDEVKALNEEFKKMDTRTPRTELNELAGTAGRLGIQAKEDVLEFVEAADMINVALGEDLGEDAIKNIGKLSDMFGDSSKSMKENMLAIGSAVNSVAQNSSASEPYLVEFTARMGGVAKQANLAITDVMGFASALDQNMLRSEMASTALSGLIMKIYQEPAKYAKLAGMDVKEFTDLMEKDVNAAILSFLESLGNLGGMNKMAPVLKEMKLSGAEAAGVISTLAGNVAKVRKEQRQASEAFAEGTSIVNEFNVQNNTVQAELDKAKERFADIRRELGEQLLPVMKYMVSTGSLTVKGLSNIITLFGKYGFTISAVTAMIVGYTAVVNTSILADKAKVLWTDKVAASFTKLWSVLKNNPWGLLLTAGAFLAGLAIDLKRRNDAVTESMRSQKKVSEAVTEQIDREAASVHSLYNNINNENLSNEVRLKYLNQLKTLIPGYNGMLSKEGKLINDNKRAIDEYLSSLERKIRTEAAEEELKELIRRKRSAEKRLVGELETEKETSRNLSNAEFSAHNQSRRLSTPGTRMLSSGLNQGVKQMQTLHNAAAKAVNKTKTEIKELDDAIAVLNRELAVTKVVVEDVEEESGNPSNNTGDSDKADEYKNRLEALQRAQREEENVIRESQLLSQDYEALHQQMLYEIDIKYLALRKKLQDEFGEDSSETQKELLEKMIAESNRQAKALEEARKPIEVEEEVEEDNYLIEKFKNSLEGREAILQAQRDADLISEEEYQDELLEITREKSERRAEIQKASMQVVADLAGSFSSLFSALMDGEIQKVESRYDKQIAAAKAAGKDTTKLEEQKEAEINAIKKKYADKQFAAAVLQVTATTAITAMEAYKAMAGIPVVGPALGAAAAAAALVAGAAQIAVAKQQRDEAKGLKSGGYSSDYVEGYTSRGNPDDVAGVIPVHKNEFVANHVAVGNPHVKRFLDVFDLAQKDGSIRWIDTTQILERTRTRAGRYSGGYSGQNAPTSVSSVASGSDGQVVQLLNRIIILLQTGNENTSKMANQGIPLDVRTIRDGLKKLDRLEANVSR